MTSFDVYSSCYCWTELKLKHGYESLLSILPANGDVWVRRAGECSLLQQAVINAASVPSGVGDLFLSGCRLHKPAVSPAWEVPSLQKKKSAGKVSVLPTCDSCRMTDVAWCDYFVKAGQEVNYWMSLLALLSPWNPFYLLMFLCL